MNTEARIRAVASLVAEENHFFENSDIEGFLPYDPMVLAETIMKVIQHMQPDDISLDMGSGTGGWWLLAAAAGIPSYAIEINPQLVLTSEKLYAKCVEKELIDPRIPCKIVCGNMIPVQWQEEYIAFKNNYEEARQSMPLEGADPYVALMKTLSQFHLIYCWSWPTQSRFLFNMLEKEMDKETMFVLPSYVRYTQGEHMNASMKEKNTLILRIIEKEKDIVVGKRVVSETFSINED